MQSPAAATSALYTSAATQPIPSLFHRPYHFNFRPSTFDYGPVAPRVATAGRTDLHTIVRTLSTNIHTVISILAHTYLRFCNVSWCIEHHQHQQQQYGVCKRCTIIQRCQEHSHSGQEDRYQRHAEASSHGQYLGLFQHMEWRSEWIEHIHQPS